MRRLTGAGSVSQLSTALEDVNAALNGQYAVVVDG